MEWIQNGRGNGGGRYRPSEEISRIAEEEGRHTTEGLHSCCPWKERATYLFLTRGDIFKRLILSAYLAFESKVTVFLFNVTNLVAGLDFSSNRLPRP